MTEHTTINGGKLHILDRKSVSAHWKEEDKYYVMVSAEIFELTQESYIAFLQQYDYSTYLSDYYLSMQER